MELRWVREDTPIWDEGKERIAGGAPAGSLGLPELASGALVPGEWFRVESSGSPVGYGWMDCTWGDAEVTIVVDSAHRGQGIGEFIVRQLESEASARGVNYLYNRVRETHPAREAVTRWLEALGFEPSGDGLLKKRVGR